MLTNKEEDELFEILTEKQEILAPETCCILRDFMKRTDVPSFDYFRFCHALRFIYGQTAEQSHKILERIIKEAETYLDTIKKRTLTNSEKRDLFYRLYALGIPPSKIAQLIEIPQNTASRWKNISGRMLIISESKRKNSHASKINPNILEGRRYFIENFGSIMRRAETIILSNSKEITPARLETYLKSCREGHGIIYSRRSLSKFISIYKHSKSHKNK